MRLQPINHLPPAAWGSIKDYKVIKKQIKLVFATSLFSLHLKEHEEVTGIALRGGTAVFLFDLKEILVYMVLKVF